MIDARVRAKGNCLIPKRFVKGRSGVAATLCLAVALAGCSLFRGSPPETYELTAPAPRPANGTAAQILIPEPSALKTLDSERIVVSSGPRLSYYPDAQWPDRMPRVFQAKAIEAFEKSKRVKAVGRPGEGLSIDYQLVTNIRSFEFREQGQGGSAYVSVYVKVMDDRTGRVVATRTFEGEAPVSKDTAASVVAGVNEALNQVLVELVSWTLKVI